MKIISALILFLLLTLPIRAQIAESDKKDKSSVSIPVIVSDREGHYIPGLKKEDFSIFQDGVKQEITFFATYDEPLNIALLLDTSGSTEDVARKIKSAAKDFVQLLNPQDKCLIATFDNEVKILNPFTSDGAVLKNSLNKIKSAQLGGTLMYNAVRQVTQNYFADVQGRKVVVILTDGKDFGSVVTKEELLDQFEESDILIYTIFYRTGAAAIDPATGGNEKNRKKSRRKKNVIIPTGAIYIPTEEEMTMRERSDEAEAIDALKKMSDTTAGRFYLSDAPGLSGIFKRMAGELREQYRLGYRPENAGGDTAVHDIIIKVSKPDAVVRFREKVRGN